MPRHADPGLDKRIVDAALRLWHARGDKGLTLRGVAREARTTTTTVYKRFRNKEELRLAIADRVRQRIAAVTMTAPTIEEVYRRYLRFAQSHPREYTLLFGPAWVHVVGAGRPRPVRAWLMNQLAKRFGGVAEDYLLFFNAIFLLMHGAASLICVAPRSADREAEENSVAMCDLLLKNPQIFRNNRNGKPQRARKKTKKA